MKMWYSNNLKAVGKRGGVSFVFGVAFTAFIFGGNFSSYAYVLDAVPTSSYQPTEILRDGLRTSQETSPSTGLKLDLNQAGKINEITAPVNNLVNSALNGLKFNQNINIGTWIPLSPIKNSSQNIDFSKFFSSSKFSSNDIMSFLKEAAVTVINLTILVISITTQVLKGLLSVFNK